MSPWHMKAANIRRAWEHFESGDLRLDSKPFRASIELTQNCNFKCVMCAHAWTPRFAEYHAEYNMKVELFEKVAAQLFPAAVSVDLRGFGETTILPYWPDLVEHLQQYPFVEWNLVSNLSLSRGDTWDLMMRSHFVVGASIDGASADVFESIRVGSNFQRIRATLGIIRDAIARHGSGYLYFISVIQAKNVHQMRAIVELAREFDVTEVQFHLVRGFGDGWIAGSSLAACGVEAVDAAIDLGVTTTFDAPAFTRRVDAGKLRRATARVAREPSKSTFLGVADAEDMPHFEVKLRDAYRVSEHQRCFKPFAYANVNYAGEMGPCNHLQHPAVIFGDLDRQPLEDIWNGEAYQDFRRQLLAASPRDSRCQWCFRNRLTD